MSRSPVWLALALWMPGCAGASDKDNHTTDEADADTDTDTDADSDSDSDADADPGFIEHFVATMEYVTADADGVTVCDATIELAGTPFTGNCHSCTYAFDIEATVTRDDGATGCELDPLKTWVTDGTFSKMYLEIGADLYTYNGATYGLEYFRVVGRYTSPENATSYGYPLWYDYSHHYGESHASTDSTFTQVGNYVYLDMDRTRPDYTWLPTYPTYGCYSPEYAQAPIYTSAVGAYSDTGDSHCGYATGTYLEQYDVWSVTPASGQTVTISVDTVAAATAFDPYFWILDQDECTLGSADDSFTCSYPPSSGSCPSMEFIADAETYKIIVGSYGACTGTTADYEIRVDAPSDPTLTPVADNTVNELIHTAGLVTSTFIDLDGEIIP
jgi:hypothetical protein